MKRKAVVAIILIQPMLFFSGVFVGMSSTPAREEVGIFITSVVDGEIVHSKVWIDATFPEGTCEKKIKINGTEVANYTPFLWNNIHAKAGKYNITVEGTHEKNGNKINSTKSIEIIIPTSEIFIGNRNDFVEDHVIHDGQSITWKDGMFNLSMKHVINGGEIHDLVYHHLDIFGNLTIINASMFGIIFANVKNNGILTIINSSFIFPGENYNVYAGGNSIINVTNSMMGIVHFFMDSTGYRKNSTGIWEIKEPTASIIVS